PRRRPVQHPRPSRGALRGRRPPRSRRYARRRPHRHPRRAPPRMTLRVLIVDDERLAREKIRGYLGGEPDVEIVGECADGGEGGGAAAAFRRRRPDVVFLDVQMPGGGGFDVLAEVGAAAMAVIFVTAHDEYAVQAFEVDALDYLLKPFDRPRFRRALARARAAVRPLGRLIVREGDRIRLVPVDAIDWIEAADNYVTVHAG